MLKNYLTVALRNLRRNRTSAFINITGLAIAFSCCIFIVLFIMDELNYDRYHANSAHIYRIQQKTSDMGYGPGTSWLLAETLTDEFPEVKSAARIQESTGEQVYIEMGEELIGEDNDLFADNSVFEIFTLPLQMGDAASALSAPNSIVISRDMAEKYFEDQNAMGQVLRTNIRSQWFELQVSGILDDIPSNSSFDVDLIFPWAVQYAIYDQPGRDQTEPHPRDTWSMIGTSTYVLLEPSSNVEDLSLKLENYFRDLPFETYISGIQLQPLTDIHLYQTGSDGNRTAGGIQTIYLFATIAVLILLVAGINYVVLSSATGAARAREIGVRKVVGAHRSDLVKQFLSESILLSLLSLILAGLVVDLLLPWVNNFMGKELDANYFPVWQFVLILMGGALLVGLASGGYVALYLTAMQPVTTIKQKMLNGHSRSRLRKTLIVIQFTVFVILMVSSLTIYQQLRYIQHTQLGFDEEQLIAIDMSSSDFGRHYNAFKTEIQGNPDIKGVSAGLTLPLVRTGVMFREANLPDNPDQSVRYFASYVDNDFFETLNTPVVKGRTFSPDRPSDLSESVVLNQMAVNTLGLDNPVGSIIELQDGPARVIGIVDDWLVSFYNEAMPLVFYFRLGDSLIGSMIIRIGPEHMGETLRYLADVWSTYAPEAIFSYQFIDEELNRQYESDRRLGVVITIFSGLSIAIASMGLFGLALFMIRLKRKEFSVRRVFGASVRDLTYIQYREIVILVIFGCVIAWPIAWYAAHRWLENFAYRINLGPWIFLLAGLLALVIALATVSWHTLRAATANPVEALRCE